MPQTPGAAYLTRTRGPPVALCEEADVRFAPDFLGRPAVVFPLQDGSGATVARQGRYIDGKDNPRMRTVGTKRDAVFATPDALPLGDPLCPVARPVLIVEAPIDGLSLAAARFPAVAVCGCDSLPPWLLARCAFRTVGLAFDADEAGDKAARALAPALPPVAPK